MSNNDQKRPSNPKNGNNTATSSSSSLANKDIIEEFIRPMSQCLDEVVFLPIYKSMKQLESESSLCKAVNVAKINCRIEKIKVAAFAFGMLSCLMFLGKFKSQPIVALVYVPLCVDSLRISYNCYIKKYMSTCSSLLAGNLSALGSTVMKMTASALGLSKQNDPILELEYGVHWPAVFEGTLSEIIYHKV